MNESTKSNLTGDLYYIKDVVRIVNPRQAMLYIKHKCYPIDVYISVDGKSNKDVLCWVFPKEQSYELYQKWCNFELE